MITKKRKSDTEHQKSFLYRYRTLIYFVSGAFVGWALKTYFPTKTIIGFVGYTWIYITDTIIALGGAGAVSSLLLALFTIYKWNKDRKK